MLFLICANLLGLIPGLMPEWESSCETVFGAESPSVWPRAGVSPLAWLRAEA